MARSPLEASHILIEPVSKVSFQLSDDSTIFMSDYLCNLSSSPSSHSVLHNTTSNMIVSIYLKSFNMNHLLNVSFFYLIVCFLPYHSAVVGTGIPPSSTTTTFNASGPMNVPVDALARCTDSTDWISPAYVQEDCETAVNSIFGHDVQRYGDIKLEFVDQGAAFSGKLPFIQTPRGYRFRSCTMAIVMLQHFSNSPPGTVPGMRPGHSSTRDISNLREASTAAANTLYRCVHTQRQLGWTEFGKKSMSSKSFYWCFGDC